MYYQHFNLREAISRKDDPTHVVNNNEKMDEPWLGDGDGRHENFLRMEDQKTDDVVGAGRWKTDSDGSSVIVVDSYDGHATLPWEKNFEPVSLTQERIAPSFSPFPKPSKPQRRALSRWLRRLIGMVLILAAGWWVAVPLFFPLTSQAVISSQLVHVRTPIEGTIQTLTKQIGDRVAVGDTLGEVADRRRDDSRLISLEQRRKETVAKTSRLQSDLDAALAEDTVVRKDLQEYNNVLSQWLNFSIEEAKSQLEADKANQTRDEELLRQGELLITNKAISREEYISRRESAQFAIETVNADRHRLEALEQELQALKQGYYLRSVPSSQDRAENLKVEIARLKNQLQEAMVQQASVEAELDQERASTARLVHATIVSPVTGVVWRRQEVEGQRVDKTESLYEVANGQMVHVEALIHQRFLTRVKPGSQVVINVAGGPTLQGVVRSIQGRDPTEKDTSYAITVPQNDLRYIHVLIDFQSEPPDPSWIGRHARIVIASSHPNPVERAVMWLFARLRV